ncbi:MAG: hypothetical protein JSR37_02995 [Verrucomicrobia bacterium]|nr:hypothetical protein [Verrucomicrobiota bacterium]MBS0636596.1 hypothetical protein [Verrucomicrobiota bacterium]
MLFLDYRLPKSSRYFLFLDAPFRYSWRHLIQYFTSRIVSKKTGLVLLTKKEQCIHFGIAFLEVLPVLGMAVVLLDFALFSKRSNKAYAHHFFTRVLPIYSKLFGEEPKQEQYILPRYIDEMKRIAHDYDVPYSDVLRANCILDRLCIFGGGSANTQETIASCFSDGKKLRYSFASDFAANRPYKKKKLPWKMPIFSHNINMPMCLLAPFTRLYVDKHCCFVGWLGLVGTYCGVNEHGVVLTATSVAGTSKNGTPNHLLFRQILEEAKSGNEARNMAQKATVASSMNLTIIAFDGRYEISLF